MTRDEMIVDALPIARYAARRFGPRDLPLADRYQEAAVALCHAADSYDADKGKWRSWAAYCVKQRMKHVSLSAALVSIPVDVIKETRRVSRTGIAEKLSPAQRHDVQAAVAIPGDETAIPQRDFNQWSEQIRTDRSDPDASKRRLEALFNRAKLSPDIARLLRLAHGIEDGVTYSLDEIAAMVKLPKNRVKQSIAWGLQRLRDVALGTEYARVS